MKKSKFRKDQIAFGLREAPYVWKSKFGHLGPATCVACASSKTKTAD